MHNDYFFFFGDPPVGLIAKGRKGGGEMKKLKIAHRQARALFMTKFPVHSLPFALLDRPNSHVEEILLIASPTLRNSLPTICVCTRSSARRYWCGWPGKAVTGAAVTGAAAIAGSNSIA
jgi:hypothetical protein